MTDRERLRTARVELACRSLHRLALEFRALGDPDATDILRALGVAARRDFVPELADHVRGFRVPAERDRIRLVVAPEIMP